MTNLKLLTHEIRWLIKDSISEICISGIGHRDVVLSERCVHHFLVLVGARHSVLVHVATLGGVNHFVGGEVVRDAVLVVRRRVMSV